MKTISHKFVEQIFRDWDEDDNKTIAINEYSKRFSVEPSAYDPNALVISISIEGVRQKDFSLSDNLIKELDIPKELEIERFWLVKCGLERLGELPTNLHSLSVHSNNLTYLPELPNGLVALIATDNKLTELPDLPTTLRYISVKNNPLSETAKDKLRQRGFDVPA